LNLLFRAQTSSEGDLLPVYRRANLSRTFVLVVALLLAAVSTGAFACRLHAADSQGGGHAIAEALGSHGPGGVFQIGRPAAEQEQTGTDATPPNRTIVALIGTLAPLLVWRHYRTERI
jgi:hypothetical protein